MPVKVHKRWIQEVSPPTLYNHGFENMGSAGAVYSRVSSNIFGDWNACGKVACVWRDHLHACVRFGLWFPLVSDFFRMHTQVMGLAP